MTIDTNESPPSGLSSHDVDFIESLLDPPAPLGWAEKALVLIYQIRNGILSDPRKAITLGGSGVMGLLLFFGAIVMSLGGGAEAARLGSCPDGDRYTIQSGDTLSKISKIHQVKVYELVAWNEIPDPDLIRVGDSLCTSGEAVVGAAVAATPPRGVVEQATGCSGGEQPGARILMDTMLVAYPSVTDEGIYNCRAPRGGRGHSTHAEGRALDLGTGVCTPEGYTIMRVAARLPGVQRVLYCEHEWRIDAPGDGWSLASPELASWHGYTPDGSPPLAAAHVHIELTNAAAGWIGITDWDMALQYARLQQAEADLAGR